jgi:hypothetical protein
MKHGVKIVANTIKLDIYLMRISSNDHIIIAFVLDHHKNRRMNQNNTTEAEAR